MKNTETMSFNIDSLKKTNERNALVFTDEEKAYDLDEMMLGVYNAFLEANHQDPIGNLVEYFLSDEPIYITRNRGARSLISSFDRYELLSGIIESYLTNLKENERA